MNRETKSTKTNMGKLPLIAAALIAFLIVAGLVWAVSGTRQRTAVQVSNEADRATPADLPPLPVAGHPAPDFTLTSTDGESLSLSDYVGRPIIVNFWASWCGPCRLEMPHLQEAHISGQDENVAVIGVNLTKRENDIGDVTAFMQEFGVTFPVMLDEDGEVAKLYEVRGQPASVFIDAAGTVQTIFYGPVNQQFIDERIEEMLQF